MKIEKINISKSCVVQIEAYEPVTSYYALEATLSAKDDVNKCWVELNDKLQKWIEFEILKWKAPNRALTAGRKLGIYDPLPKKNESLSEYKDRLEEPF